MELKDYLEEYKALTLDIMEQVNIDGNIKFLLDERERILDKISKSNFNKDEIINIGKSLKLLELEAEMQKMVKVEKANIKRKLQNLRIREQGNKGYLNVNYSQYGMSRFDRFDKSL